jgi:hypothetical protein
VPKVRMTWTTRRNNRELTITSAYLPYDSNEPPLSRGLKEVLTIAVGIKCRSLLDLMPLHTTRGGVWTSMHDENA